MTQLIERDQWPQPSTQKDATGHRYGKDYGRFINPVTDPSMNYDEFRERLRRIDEKEVGAGASVTQIADAERGLGVAFPSEYKRLLEDFGWMAVGSTEIFGLGDDVPEHLNVVGVAIDERTQAHMTIPPNLLPIMNDGGGNLYCVDCADAVGSVVVWDHTAGLDDLGASFVDWLADEIAV